MDTKLYSYINNVDINDEQTIIKISSQFERIMENLEDEFDTYQKLHIYELLSYLSYFEVKYDKESFYQEMNYLRELMEQESINYIYKIKDSIYLFEKIYEHLVK